MNKKNIFITIMLGISACLLHFTFDFFKQSYFIAPFVPVNESVWEHLKLVFFPLVIFFGIMSKKDISWLFPGSVSVLFAPAFITVFFYTYTGALGIESLPADILSTFAAFFLSLSLAEKIKKSYKYTKIKTVTALSAVSVLFIFFIVFTFSPPSIPLFISK